MPRFYVEVDHRCGIVEGVSSDAVRQEVVAEVGTQSRVTVRLASKADIAWVESMGGTTPQSKEKN